MKHDLASTFVVLQPDQRAALVENAPGVFEELDRRFAGFKGHVLVATFAFDAEEVVQLQQPGEYVLVPKGTWHTARTAVPTNLLFVTPGEGTENKPA